MPTLPVEMREDGMEQGDEVLMKVRYKTCQRELGRRKARLSVTSARHPTNQHAPATCGMVA